MSESQPPSRPVLSVVSPVYQAEGIVDELVRRTIAALKEVTADFEILLVEDGSADGSWGRIAAACATEPRVKGIRLSRNFGQHQAISAGIDAAEGHWVAVMDCDLQDDPAEIPRLLAKAREGHDVVLALHRRRAHGFVRNLLARLFSSALNQARPGGTHGVAAGTFSLLSRRAVLAFRRVPDVHRHYLGVLSWLGFSVATISIDHRPRFSGRSSYDLPKLLRHASDGITSQSNRPLHLALWLGAAFAVCSFLATLGLVVGYWAHGFLEGWTSTIVVVLMAASANLLVTGAIGLYVGKVFDQVRQRPLYLVAEVRNLDRVSVP